MSQIHPTAQIGENVQIGQGTEIGPQVIIEDNVSLGTHNKILAGAYIAQGTTLGDHNTIHMRAIIGHEPQDISFDPSKETFTQIGSHNTIREFVTIHRGTAEGTATIIGDHNFIMAYGHIAHNCQIGNHIIMVNQASLTGHCMVEDRAFLSGMTGLHQFTRVGKLSLLSALSAVNKDIPPFIICGGRPAIAQGLNVIGMRRAGISQEVRTEVKRAYKLLYLSGMNTRNALEKIKSDLEPFEEVKHFVQFIEESKRGIIKGPSNTEEEQEVEV